MMLMRSTVKRRSTRTFMTRNGSSSRATTAAIASYSSRAATPAVCCAVVYISEGRDSALLDSLAEIADIATSSAGLIRQFRDPTYHRTGFTIGGTAPCVAEASLEVSRSALRAIDLRAHKASHPRVGVVDHVSIHPVGNTAEAKASACETGRTIAETLGREGLPVLLYGDLKDDRRLAEVRKSTPYFGEGSIPGEIEADLGPNQVNAAHGIATIGCTPLVTNYNVLLDTRNKGLAAAITRSVREKDGGLAWVEALTLKREDGRFETACNLLRPKDTTPAMVLAAAAAQATRLGVVVEDEYTTGLTEEEVMQAILRLLEERRIRAS